jgi:NCAIR mutase (PurE)-related protein
MNRNTLNELLTSLANGQTNVQTAYDQLRHLAMEDIDFAHIDHHRSLRKGFPEVIFGQGKSADQIVGIMQRMMLQERVILATRVDPEKALQVRKHLATVDYDAEARMLIWRKGPVPITGQGTVLVLSAGTSDIPIAREACLTAEAMGNQVQSIHDVGVAGIHRLLSYRERIQKARVLIVVAGMEGALPSVVAGMVRQPVIAVPTSIGYGVSLGGLTALFGMLSSCSSNVAVVNIDNGFGAGYMASCINHP